VTSEQNDLPQEQRPNSGQFTKGNDLQWQPGKSGNLAGRPPNKDSITYQIKQALAKGEGIEAKALAKMAIKEAKAGSYPHFREILDRTDGKVTETHAILGNILIEVVYKEG
ncbi:hypothetical protein LCGC14_2140260, partial [marine sediment metagenome]